MDTKEIVALTEKWLGQFKEVTVNYSKAIATIEAVKEDYRKQQKKWYNIILPYLMPVIIIIVLLVAFAIFLHSSACPNPIDIRFQELELTQSCK